MEVTKQTKWDTQIEQHIELWYPIYDAQISTSFDQNFCIASDPVSAGVI